MQPSLAACNYACDAKAVPLARGNYRSEADLHGYPYPPHPDAVLRAELEIGEREVTVEYMRGDGRSYRASYAIVGRGKTLR